MSHPTIKFHSAPSPLSAVALKAVMIPPSGPSPGHRSAMVVTPSPACLPGATTTRTLPATPRSNSHIRSTIALPSISASALSRPNRVLPPPASTYPDTPRRRFSVNSVLIVLGFPRAAIPSILFLYRQLKTNNQLLFFNRLAPWPPDSQLPQFLLQALPVQTDGRRGARDVPAMIRQLLGQVRHLKLALGLAKIFFAQAVVVPACRLQRNRLAARHFLRQIRDADLFATAQHQAALQRIFQFAHIS